MGLNTEQTPPKAVNSYRQRNWPDTVSHLGGLIISKNLLLPAGALAFLLLATWKLDSADLRSLIDTILNRRWFAVAGWTLFIGTVFVSIKIVKWQSKIYQERRAIDEAPKVDNSTPQRQLPLENKAIQITEDSK